MKNTMQIFLVDSHVRNVNNGKMDFIHTDMPVGEPGMTFELRLSLPIDQATELLKKSLRNGNMVTMKDLKDAGVN